MDARRLGAVISVYPARSSHPLRCPPLQATAKDSVQRPSRTISTGNAADPRAPLPIASSQRVGAIHMGSPARTKSTSVTTSSLASATATTTTSPASSARPPPLDQATIHPARGTGAGPGGPRVAFGPRHGSYAWPEPRLPRPGGSLTPGLLPRMPIPHRNRAP